MTGKAWCNGATRVKSPPPQRRRGRAMMPRSRATTTAAVRSSTPSLAKACSRWVLTVASLMNRVAAMAAPGHQLQDLDLAAGEGLLGGRPPPAHAADQP